MVVVGSKVDRVKRRRVMKMRRAQMEMVDWALEMRRLEGVRLRVLLMIGLKQLEDEEDDDEDDVVEEEEKRSVFFLLISMDSSSGKSTRRKPIPQPSLLPLAFAVNNLMPPSLSLSL